MASQTCHNLLAESLLQAASILSFVPQLSKLAHSDAKGIDIYYVWLNTVAFTEQLALGLLFFPPYRYHDKFPHIDDAGNVLNTVQLAILSILFFILFVAVIAQSPVGKDTISILMYTIAFTVLAGIAAVLDFIQHIRFSFGGCGRPCIGAHHYLIMLTTLLSALSAIPQVRVTRRLKSPGALSILGLAVQTIVFILLGVSWFYRIPGLEVGMNDWYFFGGWAAVGMLVFAGVQAVVLGNAMWVVWKSKEREDGERRPLLEGRDTVH